MIVSHIALLDRELALYPGRIRRGLTYLRDTDFSALAPGRVDLAGDDLFALIQDYVPEPFALRRAETHAAYADIQFMAAGREVIGYAPLTPGLAPCEDRLDREDVAFYADPPGETALAMPTGAYAIFFPWDVHRPGWASWSLGPLRGLTRGSRSRRASTHRLTSSTAVTHANSQG